MEIVVHDSYVGTLDEVYTIWYFLTTTVFHWVLYSLNKSWKWPQEYHIEQYLQAIGPETIGPPLPVQIVLDQWMLK